MPSCSGLPPLDCFGDPQNIGLSKQLFLDDGVVERTEAISRILNVPRKSDANPILRPEKEWEGNTVNLTAVIFDESDSLWKMWYGVRTISVGASSAALGQKPGAAADSIFDASHYKETGNYTCYASSRDGIHWDRPDLGLVDFKGSKNNNLVPVDRHIGWLPNNV